MERRKVKVIVEQSIDYADQAYQEDFLVETEGELLRLQTFSRLAYRDNMDVPIEVKWQKDRQRGHYLIDIKQPTYILNFNPLVTTFTQYDTPYGEWILEVNTKQLEVEETAGRVELSIKYQIKENQRPLGDYYFRLILEH